MKYLEKQEKICKIDLSIIFRSPFFASFPEKSIMPLNKGVLSLFYRGFFLENHPSGVNLQDVLLYLCHQSWVASRERLIDQHS